MTINDHCVCVVCMCPSSLLPPGLHGNSLLPLTLMEEHVGVVTQATASDAGSVSIATVTLYLQANSKPVMV